MPINFEAAITEWAKASPLLQDKLLYDFLNSRDGAISITQESHKVLKTYINGAAIKEYIFALGFMYFISDTTDNKNTENMFSLRLWQNWINEQQALKNYPDFGAGCSGYKAECLQAGPQMALRYENNMAKYQFFAKITYIEEVYYG